jgi:hypothetical protein
MFDQARISRLLTFIKLRVPPILQEQLHRPRAASKSNQRQPPPHTTAINSLYLLFSTLINILCENHVKLLYIAKNP